MLRALILFIFLGTYLPALAEDLDLLGSRQKACKNMENDEWIVNIPKSLVDETRTFFDKNLLRHIVVEDPHCYRTGTEIKLFLVDEEDNYLGRALVTSSSSFRRSQLTKIRSLPYSRPVLKDYLNSTSAKKFSVLEIRVSEKVKDYFVDGDYQRLPTCFPTYNDWESFRVLDENPEKAIKDIQKGKITAQIWNGTFNCYKVRKVARIVIPQPKTEAAVPPQPLNTPKVDYGAVRPTQLHLVHYTRLTKQHADLVGEKLSDLKARMEQNKDVDGGYTTIVVFDYLEPLPEKDGRDKVSL